MATIKIRRAWQLGGGLAAYTILLDGEWGGKSVHGATCGSVKSHRAAPARSYEAYPFEYGGCSNLEIEIPYGRRSLAFDLHFVARKSIT